MSKKDRFSAVKSIGRNEIITQPERFQGRETDYSHDTVKAIVSKGYYDNSRDPIILWYDVVEDKNVVLAGHSRLEAWDILSKKNPDMVEIPAIFLNGDLDDAVVFANVESNRGSTQETLIESLNAYRIAISYGRSRKWLLGAFKPESTLNKLQKLSNLNPKGRFIEMLSGDAALSFPYLERNAMWIGDMRSSLPSLSDSHELELFKFIYETGKGLKLTKAQLYKVVEDRVGRIDFNPAEPLNLENRVSASAYTDPIIEQIALVNKEIERADKEIRTKREILATAKKDKIAPKITDPIFKKIDDLNRFILRKIQEREDLKQKAGKVERTMTADLFSIAPEQKPERVVKSGPNTKDVYGVLMDGIQEMNFSKYLANEGIAMNTKTPAQRKSLAKIWLINSVPDDEYFAADGPEPVKKAPVKEITFGVGDRIKYKDSSKRNGHNTGIISSLPEKYVKYYSVKPDAPLGAHYKNIYPDDVVKLIKSASKIKDGKKEQQRYEKESEIKAWGKTSKAKSIIKLAAKYGFNLDSWDDEKQTLSFETRENGNTQTETQGKADLEARKKAISAIREEHKDVSTRPTNSGTEHVEFDVIIEESEPVVPKPKFKVGDKVAYKGEVYDIGFVQYYSNGRWKGTYRLQQGPTGKQVSRVYEEHLTTPDKTKRLRLAQAKAKALKLKYKF